MYTSFLLDIEGLQDKLTSLKKRCLLPLERCPLADLFLRGVAKIKDLQEEISCVLMFHLEVLIITCWVALVPLAILTSQEATTRNVIDDQILIHV
jgi:hypothetical protein